MPQLSPQKVPLPCVASIFIFWLLFLAISSGMVFLYALTSGAFSLFFILAIFIFICIATMPIADFYNRSPRAILSSRIASGIFSFLTFTLSFSVINLIGITTPPSEGIDTSLLYTPNFIWITSMGLAFTSALLLSFFFYAQNSHVLRKCLHTSTNSKKHISLPLGCLATLSAITIVLSLRFLLGLAFFSNSIESETLPFALLVSLPHFLIAVSLLSALRKETPSSSLSFRLGSWILVSLIMMASRNYIVGMYGNFLPQYLVPIFSIFLYVLPNALIVALPLVWWSLHCEKTENPRERVASFSFIEQLVALPLPLTIALLYIGFQGFLFAFNGISSQLVSINSFSSELQNTALHLSGAEQQNGTFFFAIAMLPFSLICVVTTLKNPYQGVQLCRIFCLLSTLLHGLAVIVLLSLGFSAIESSHLLLSEATFYCFTSVVAYVAFSVIYNILLLPHEEKRKEHIRSEDIISEENTNRHEEKILLGIENIEQNNERKESQEGATSYLDRVRPQLSQWFLLFIPQKGQPLPVFLFTFFCFAILARWVAPAFFQACMLFFSPEKAARDLAQTFFVFSLVGASFPLIGARFAQKRIRAKSFILFLSFWLMSIILLGSYAIVPSFSLLTPESMGIIAMLWYSKKSALFQAWFKKDETSFYT